MIPNKIKSSPSVLPDYLETPVGRCLKPVFLQDPDCAWLAASSLNLGTCSGPRCRLGSACRFNRNQILLCWLICCLPSLPTGQSGGCNRCPETVQVLSGAVHTEPGQPEAQHQWGGEGSMGVSAWAEVVVSGQVAGSGRPGSASWFLTSPSTAWYGQECLY